jgi:hypothetical protein
VNLILRCIPVTAIAASEIQKAGMGTDLWMPLVGNSVPGNVPSAQSRLAFGCAPQDKGAATFAVDRRQPPYLSFLRRSPEQRRTRTMMSALQRRERSDRSPP